MVNCCRKNSLRGYESIKDANPKSQNVNASYCGAPFSNRTANKTWHFTALAVMGACTVFFTSRLFNPEYQRDDQSLEFGLITASLTILTLASFISEGLFLKNRCMTSRHFPAPLPLVTSAIICGCIAWIIFEKRAHTLIDNYNYTEEFIKHNMDKLQKGCVDDVDMLPQSYTNNDCTVCDRDSGWFASTHGPFQAWQDMNVSAVYCFEPKIEYPCLMTRDWLHNIKMNYTYPHQKYLCGNTITTTTLNETQHDGNRCVLAFLETYLGFYPPMFLKVEFLENNCVSFAGSATYRNIIAQQCYPYADRLIPYPLRMPCASSYYIYAFNELDKQFQTLRNYSLPYPQRAYDLLDITDNYALAFSMFASILATGTYDIITCSHRRHRRLLLE